MFSYLFIICIVLPAYPRTATGVVLGLAYMSSNIKSTWAVLGESLGSHSSESSSLRAVFRQPWCSHCVVVRQLLGRHQAVVKQSSSSSLFFLFSARYNESLFSLVAYSLTTTLYMNQYYCIYYRLFIIRSTYHIFN